MASFKDLGKAFGDLERKRFEEETKAAAEAAAAKEAADERRKRVDAATASFADDAYSVLLPAFKALREGDPRMTHGNIGAVNPHPSRHQFVKDGLRYQWLCYVTITLQKKGGLSGHSLIDIGFAKGVDDAAYDAVISVSRHRENDTTLIFEAFRPVVAAVSKDAIEAVLLKMVEHFSPKS